VEWGREDSNLRRVSPVEESGMRPYFQTIYSNGSLSQAATVVVAPNADTTTTAHHADTPSKSRTVAERRVEGEGRR
jgi:hypothetical protein